MPGGSVWTTAHTYGRRETVEECGEQPQEPRERCASLKKPSVSLEREKERDQGSGEKEKATRCTSCCTYPPTQLQQRQQSSNSSISSSGSTITALNTIMKERITDGIVSQPLHPGTGGLRRSERHCRSGGTCVRWHSCRMLS